MDSLGLDVTGILYDAIQKDWARTSTDRVKVLDSNLRVACDLFSHVALSTIHNKQLAKEAKGTVTAGISTTTLIAGASDGSDKEDNEGVSVKHVKVEIDPSERLAKKLAKFASKNSYRFKNVCESGFPFSKIAGPEVKTTFETVIKSYSPFFFQYLMHSNEEWMDEITLNAKFSELVQEIELKEIQETLRALKKEYATNLKAGYYFLWLLKTKADLNYEIPAKESFNQESLKEVLSTFLKGDIEVRVGVMLVELLHFRDSRLDTTLFMNILDDIATNRFIDCLVFLVKEIPFTSWPNKIHHLQQLFESIREESKSLIADAIRSSSDPKTSELGSYFYSAVTEKPLRNAIPYFYLLQENFPDQIDLYQLTYVFGCPIPNLQRGISLDPEFVKRLSFNASKKVFVHGSLIIGAHDTKFVGAGKKVPAHLLAYDLHTERLVWAIPLMPTPTKDPFIRGPMGVCISGFSGMDGTTYTLDEKGEFITLKFKESAQTLFIDPKTGDIHHEFLSLKQPHHTDKALQFCDSGFSYHKRETADESLLIGGTIDSGNLIESFRIPYPKGRPDLYDTHIGFGLMLSRHPLLLISPTGGTLTIEGAISAKGIKGKLCLIKPDPANTQGSIFTMQSLLCTNEVVSPVEKIIPLTKEADSIDCITENGYCVLFDGSYSTGRAIYINLLDDSVTYADHNIQCFGISYVDKKTATIWSWDCSSKEIWKTTPLESISVGKFDSGRDTQIVYVDELDHLYFI